MALNRERVLREALQLVDDDGLDALSLRTLASRLAVQAPTLYWHVKNKSELLDGIADAVMDEAIEALPDPDPEPPTDGRDWLLEALTVLRATMLRHRDGARILSGSRQSLRRADFSERAMATLVGRGILPRQARLLVLAGERFTVGWVLEEQAPPPPAGAPMPTEDELRARFPVSTQAIGDYFINTGRTADDLFLEAARLVLHLPDASQP